MTIQKRTRVPDEDDDADGADEAEEEHRACQPDLNRSGGGHP